MARNIALNDAMRTQLFLMACEMALNGRYRRTFKRSDMEGYVTTDYKEGRIASLTGVFFTAKVETELGSGEIEFLVRPADVSAYTEKDFVWQTERARR